MAVSAYSTSLQRRRGLAWASLVAAVVAAVVLLLDFLYPRDAALNRHFEAGLESRFAPGSVTYFPEQHFFLARLPTGEFRAFHDLDIRQQLMPLPPGRSTPCRLEWFGPEEVTRLGFSHQYPDGLFREPCHLSTYTIEGKRIYGPAFADLPQFRVTAQGVVTVDLSKATCFVYADNSRRDCLRNPWRF